MFLMSFFESFFDSIFDQFSVHLGTQHELQNGLKMGSKSIKKINLFLIAFLIDFWWFLGPSWGPKLTKIGQQIDVEVKTKNQQKHYKNLYILMIFAFPTPSNWLKNRSKNQ